jgi:hypothetical protein
MSSRTLGVVSGSVILFLLILGAAKGATIADVHDRMQAVPPVAVTAAAVDAHDRAVTAAAGLPLDAHDRVGVAVESPALASSTTWTHGWSGAAVAAGTTLVLLGLGAFLVSVRRHRRLALP